MGSAQGVVQDLGYVATFPLLLNIAGQPTYFIALKDSSQPGEAVRHGQRRPSTRWWPPGPPWRPVEQEYIRSLGDLGITAPEALPQTTASGVIAELRSAVLEGNTYYFLRLEGEEVFTRSRPPTTMWRSSSMWGTRSPWSTPPPGKLRPLFSAATR